MKLAITAILAILGTSSAYSTTKASSRRELLSNVAKGAVFGIGAIAVTPNADALEICGPKANNCVRTTFTPPAGSSKDDVAAALRDAINAYPQEGQSDVDKGGWTIASDDLSGAGTARIEYKSGIGKFAKFFNGGKPFVDDLKFEIDGSNVVQVRSQSRVGDSDFGVNQKRVDYIEATLKKAGW